MRDLIARQSNSGLWMQVLDAPDLEGNYEESSATAMFAYALLRAARLNVIDADDAKAATAAGRLALDGLLTTRLLADAFHRHSSRRWPRRL